MLITLSGAKLVICVHDIQLRTPDGATLYAMIEDVTLHKDALILVADGGAVRWSWPIESLHIAEQIEPFLIP